MPILKAMTNVLRMTTDTTPQAGEPLPDPLPDPEDIADEERGEKLVELFARVQVRLAYVHKQSLTMNILFSEEERLEKWLDSAQDYLPLWYREAVSDVAIAQSRPQMGEWTAGAIATLITVIKANCEMFETEDDEFFRRVYIQAIFDTALKFKQVMIDEQWSNLRRDKSSNYP